MNRYFAIQRIACFFIAIFTIASAQPEDTLETITLSGEQRGGNEGSVEIIYTASIIKDGTDDENYQFSAR